MGLLQQFLLMGYSMPLSLLHLIYYLIRFLIPSYCLTLFVPWPLASVCLCACACSCHWRLRAVAQVGWSQSLSQPPSALNVSSHRRGEKTTTTKAPQVVVVQTPLPLGEMKNGNLTFETYRHICLEAFGETRGQPNPVVNVIIRRSNPNFLLKRESVLTATLYKYSVLSSREEAQVQRT